MSQTNHPQGQQNLETALSWHKTCHINKNIRQEKAKHLTKSQKHIRKMVHVHICPKKLCFARKNWHIAAESEPSCTIGRRISQKVEQEASAFSCNQHRHNEREEGFGPCNNIVKETPDRSDIEGGEHILQLETPDIGASAYKTVGILYIITRLYCDQIFKLNLNQLNK